MNLMIRMVPLPFGQTRGATSHIFWISRAQPFLLISKSKHTLTLSAATPNVHGMNIFSHNAL